jgi:sec-independent protein translocase protein TatB
MFDIGFWELAIIFVVALLVVGPQRLPGLVRSAVYWLRRARQMTDDVKTEISAELDKAEDLKRLMEEQADIVKRAEQEFKQAMDVDADKTDSDVKEKKAEAKAEIQPESETPAKLPESKAESEAAVTPPPRPRAIPASNSAPRLRPQQENVEPVSVAAEVKDETKS